MTESSWARIWSLSQRILALGLGGLEIVLEFLDVALLVLFAAIKAREQRDEVLYLLLLDDEVARQLLEAGLELVGGKRID